MKTKEFVTYRIVFVPDEELIKKVVALASEISKLGEVYFRVDEKNYFSHLTIYKAEFPVENDAEVFKVVKRCTENIRILNIKFGNFYSELGWIGLDFERDKEVYQAHELIVNTLNPLRKGHIRKKYLDKLKNGKILPVKREEHIEKYGYPQVMSEYHPHLSMTRFVDEEKAKEVTRQYNDKKIEIKKSRIGEIAIVQGGDHGTVTKIIKKYKLKT